MKKYKLIKEYPGSPMLGSYTGNTYDSGIACKVIRPDGITFSNSFGWYWVTNFPEFWEEIVEIDYKILSVLLQRPDKHQIQNVSEYNNNGYVESLVNCAGNKIHSIKRLSDGEIFTIGDTVNNSNFGANGTLNRIRIIEGTNCLSFGVDFFIRDKNSDDSECVLDNLSIVKQPLFTTEDGVDIFKGDSYCKVNNYSDYSILTGFIGYGAHDNYKGLKFSNKEAAQEYVLMNKPCLSFMEIMYEISLTATGKKTLKSLIEKKLNKQI